MTSAFSAQTSTARPDDKSCTIDASSGRTRTRRTGRPPSSTWPSWLTATREESRALNPGANRGRLERRESSPSAVITG